MALRDQAAYHGICAGGVGKEGILCPPVFPGMRFDSSVGNETVRHEQGTPPELRGTPQGQMRNGKLEIGIGNDYAPGKLEEVLTGVDLENAKTILRHVTVIWTCALR